MFQGGTKKTIEKEKEKGKNKKERIEKNENKGIKQEKGN